MAVDWIVVPPSLVPWAYYTRTDLIEKQIVHRPVENVVFQMLCAFMANPRIPEMQCAEGIIVEYRKMLRMLRRWRHRRLRNVGRKSLRKLLLRLQSEGLVRVTGLRRTKCRVRVLGYPSDRPVKLSEEGVGL